MSAAGGELSSPDGMPLMKARVRWFARIPMYVAVLLLMLDALVKIVFLPGLPEGAAQLGWAASEAPKLGYLLLACTALYAIPQTSFLGAVLLTGYLGGAVATHMRIGSPLMTHTLFGVYLGVFIWGALVLVDRRPLALFPLNWRRSER